MKKPTQRTMTTPRMPNTRMLSPSSAVRPRLPGGLSLSDPQRLVDFERRPVGLVLLDWRGGDDEARGGRRDHEVVAVLHRPAGKLLVVRELFERRVPAVLRVVLPFRLADLQQALVD